MCINDQRLFFALDISVHDKALLHQWWQQQAIEDVRAITPANYHITLAFLGRLTEKQKKIFIERVTSYTTQNIFASNYTITLTKLDYFKKPQVAYLTFESFPTSLIGLANFISNQAKIMGLFQEDRAYLPHISIARKVKHPLNITQLSHPLRINSFSLYHSQSTNDGVKYTPIKQWTLKS